MRLTSFFLVILIFGLSLLGYQSNRLQNHLDQSKRQYIEFADSFLKGSQDLAYKKFQEMKRDKEFFEKLAANDFTESDNFSDIQTFTLQFYKDRNKLKDHVFERLNGLVVEITNDLLPEFKLEKNETINNLQEKVPTQFQLAFIEFFDTQKFNRSDVGLLVNSQNVLNDLNLIKTSVLENQNLTKNKIEYLERINDYRFQEMQKLNVRHVIKLKLKRFRIEFRDLLSFVKDYYKLNRTIKSQETLYRNQLEERDRESTREFFKEQASRINNQKKFSKRALEEIKSEMKLSFLVFAFCLVLAFLILYIAISRPLSDYLKNGKTKKTFMLEIEKLIARIEEKHRENLSLQQDVLRNEKYASIGSVIHLVSHELKNPLAIMQLSLDDMKDELREKANDEMVKELVNIEKMLDRMNDLIKNLGNLGKIEAKEEEFDALNVINQIEGMFERVFAKQEIRFEVKSNRDKIIMNGLRQYVEIILLNLISNSIRAMEKSDEKKIIININQENEKIHLSVKDTGEGITSNMMKLLFEPYITSKNDKSSSGLGLNIVKNAVEKMNGTISVVSEPNQGAEFNISI